MLFASECSPWGVYCYACFQNRTPTVRGATAPPSLCAKFVAPIRDVRQGAVQIRTVGVPKCRLRQSAPLGVVYCHARFRIVHLLYYAPRDLPVCVRSLCGHPYRGVSDETVQIGLMLLFIITQLTMVESNVICYRH